VLTPRPSDTAHCARLVTRSLVRFGRRPVARGGVRFCSAHRAARGSTCAAIRGPPPVPVVNTPTAVTCPTPDGSGHRARPLSWGVLLALGAGHSTGWGLWRGHRQPVQAGGNGRAQGPTQRRYSCPDRYGSGQCHPSRRWLVEGWGLSSAIGAGRQSVPGRHHTAARQRPGHDAGAAAAGSRCRAAPTSAGTVASGPGPGLRRGRWQLIGGGTAPYREGVASCRARRHQRRRSRPRWPEPGHSSRCTPLPLATAREGSLDPRRVRGHAQVFAASACA
jgi:hypothetical protein